MSGAAFRVFLQRATSSGGRLAATGLGGRWSGRPRGRVRSVAGQRHPFSSTTQPELTSIRYPHVKRGNYATITDTDVAFFRGLMPEEGRVLTAVDDVQGYNVDWLRTVRGINLYVCLPCMCIVCICPGGTVERPHPHGRVAFPG